MVIRRALQSYPIVSFAVLACVLGWTLFIISAFGVGIEAPSNLPIAPIVAAGIVAAGMGREGWRRWTRDLGKIRASAGWYALAGAAPVVIIAAAVLVNAAFGAPRPTAAQLAGWTSLPVVLVFLLVFVGMGEEGGWTAFALPRLLDGGNLAAAWAVLAGIRIVWHLPLMLTGDLPWIVGVGGNAAFQLILLWIYLRSGRVWFLAAVWHAVLNTVGGEFFFGMVQGADRARLGMLFVCGYILTAGAVWVVDRRRLEQAVIVPGVAEAGEGRAVGES